MGSGMREGLQWCPKLAVTLDPTTEIASNFTVADYEAVRATLDPSKPQTPAWSAIVAVFRRRLEERFLSSMSQLLSTGPFSPTPSVPGFAILALDCLLIDTIQSFREGRIATGEISPARSFKAFLQSPRFKDFNSDDRNEFFHYVRNGLLHNGETRGDWKVRADQPRMLTKAASGTRTINRTLFHHAIVAEFEDYCDALTNGPPDVRERFLRRMDAISGRPGQPGCYYFAYGSNLLDTEIAEGAPSAAAESIAYVPGWRLVFNKHSRTRHGDAASIETCASQIVWGFVYRISREEKDRLAKRERGYREHQLKVLLVDDASACEKCTPVEALTFIGSEHCRGGCGPSEAYLELVVKGARLRGLPENYIHGLGERGRKESCDHDLE